MRSRSILVKSRVELSGHQSNSGWCMGPSIMHAFQCALVDFWNSVKLYAHKVCTNLCKIIGLFCCLRLLEKTSRNNSYRRSSNFTFTFKFSPPTHHGTSCSVAGGAATSPCKLRYVIQKIDFSLTNPRSSASMQRLSPTSPPPTFLVIGLENHTPGR